MVVRPRPDTITCSNLDLYNHLKTVAGYRSALRGGPGFLGWYVEGDEFIDALVTAIDIHFPRMGSGMKAVGLSYPRTPRLKNGTNWTNSASTRKVTLTAQPTPLKRRAKPTAAKRGRVRGLTAG